MKGRKPIPDGMKKLKGTDQPCRMNKTGDTPNPVSSIDAKKMKVLKNARSKRIFQEKANQLIQLQLLSEMDYEQLAIYANSLDMLFECIENLKKGKFVDVRDEFGNLVKYIPNPYLKLYKEMVDIVNKIGSEFGFSPVSRMKFNVKQDETDPLQKLMNQFQ